MIFSIPRASALPSCDSLRGLIPGILSLTDRSMLPTTDGGSEITKLLSQTVEAAGLAPDAGQMRQLATHFSLLLRWNEKINLTSVRKPDEIASRHFGES